MNSQTQLILVLFLAAMPMTGLVAAEVVLHFDVNNPRSWMDGGLSSLSEKEVRLVPTAGAASDDTFGKPVYVPAGTNGAKRAYLHFKKFGVLGFEQGSLGTESTTGLVFNSEDGQSPHEGYTMEGCFYIFAEDFNVKEATGIGTSAHMAFQNLFILVPRLVGGVFKFSSTTVVVDPSEKAQAGKESPGDKGKGYWLHKTSEITEIIPTDQWFHLVKVYDPKGPKGEVRWYVDGELVLTDAMPGPTENSRYVMRHENLGCVGMPGREIAGFGYSMTRFYRGALTAAEIKKNFTEVMRSGGGLPKK